MSRDITGRAFFAVQKPVIANRLKHDPAPPERIVL
jgi:hypothetical protein